MFRLLIATIAMLAVATVARGSGTAYIEEVRPLSPLPDSGLLACTWDIHMVLTDTPSMGSDDWSAAGLYLSVTGGTFFHDPLYDDNPPNPDNFAASPDSEFTSFYTSPGDWPNAPYDGGIVGVATDDDTDLALYTEWFDVIDIGNGDFVVARVTVIPDDQLHPNAHTQGIFRYSVVHSESLYDLPIDVWCIPEPGTFALLLLGAGAALRRG